MLFSIFLYGELSRSLVARLDDTLASEADTAAVLFPDELHEMKGDAVAAAREVVSEMKVHGDFVDHTRRQPRAGRQPASPRRARATAAPRARCEAGGRTYHIEVSASLDSIDASWPWSAAPSSSPCR